MFLLLAYIFIFTSPVLCSEDSVPLNFYTILEDIDTSDIPGIVSNILAYISVGMNNTVPFQNVMRKTLLSVRKLVLIFDLLLLAKV